MLKKSNHGIMGKPRTGGVENKKSADIEMIIGLGNPGEEYAETFHNTGARFVEFARTILLPEAHFILHSSKEFAYCKKPSFPILVIPNVFMNESGRAAARAARFFRVAPASILVVHDDSDLPLGAYRLAFARGAAGHRGVESVASSFRTYSFQRLRIGIRNEKKSETRKKAGSFVLKKTGKRDTATLTRVFEEIITTDTLGIRHVRR